MSTTVSYLRLSHRFGWTLSLVVGLSSVPAQADAQSELSCLIDPHAVVELATREEGTIKALLVDRGDDVNKGDVVARLDDDIEAATVELATAQAQVQAEIDEAKTSLDFAVREKKRIEDLYNQKAVSFREMDGAATEAARSRLRLVQARQRLTVAKLELKRAERLLDRRALRSPIDGVIVERLISVGESAENRAVVRIAQVDPLNVEVIAPVTLFGTIRTGTSAKVIPQYPGASEHVANVTVVDPVVDAASNTFGVRLELSNPARAIPAGVRCVVRFGLGTGSD
ncbi:MAG: efflux RND transporter periplasmic adaptor subunit [Pseudomonadota bacterium]